MNWWWCFTPISPPPASEKCPTGAFGRFGGVGEGAGERRCRKGRLRPKNRVFMYTLSGGSMVRWNLLARDVVVFLVVFIGGGWFLLGPRILKIFRDNTPLPQNPPGLTAQELVWGQNGNDFNWDLRYKGKSARISGTVGYIQPDNDYYVTVGLKTYGQYGSGFVDCEFASYMNGSDISRMEVGQEVVFDCRIKEKQGTHVTAYNCKVHQLVSEKNILSR